VAYFEVRGETQGKAVLAHHHGRVHEEGRPKNLFAAPQSSELTQFISSIG
jgi:polar amino acid transport system ATP-binding protein